MQLNPFSKDFHSNPADAAMPYLNQIPETIKPYYDPYVNAGQDALGQLMQQYQSLLSNPQSIYNMGAQGFTESPGYQYQMNQGMNAINNAAASGGYLGTTGHQQNAGNMASNMANQEFQNYLGQMLGLYGTGLKGMEGINTMGYGASNELANSLGNNLMNQGNMAYLGQSNQNQANADLFKTLLGGAVGIGSQFIPKPKP